ncbi:RsbR, positive regulator of sigma-B [Jeotgalibacillus sp. ET6]|uniref:RsbR, positive regulator of sigma-B n=1 Tax=Jeotgalibacillus sp. ET6 TaxID=3037260 RepID=UPI0024183F37|nr:RsbR, positive regulator of sigma-B [Jeotgalibacillus sp. ET6]MDG5472301.1 RsbR, positive regulator of sigma-B [Jeotgalibacillus sp. ET6]
MSAYGNIPKNITSLNALDSIGETIVIADNQYTVMWMNSHAKKLLSSVAPLFGLQDSQDMIGMSMNHFHQRPDYQHKIMEQLKGPHRSRITIRNQFVADIVITPIMPTKDSIEGYVVMLMDVTTKAEEEKEKEKLIQALSTPILKVWKNAIAIPLIGEFDMERFDLLITNVLERCVKDGIDYVLLSLHDVYVGEDGVTHYFQKLIDCISLIGSKCIIVGIPASLAAAMTSLERDVLIFSTTYDGLQYIIQHE